MTKTSGQGVAHKAKEIGYTLLFREHEGRGRNSEVDQGVSIGPAPPG